MKYVDGGICAAKGYKASGTYCGIKKPNVENFDPNVKHKNDICLFTSDVICNAAAVYTQNKVKGAPILVTKANLEKSGNKAIAVIANSKNANTCNADGVEKADKMCELVAAVERPLILAPSRKIRPAPRKPTPLTTCAAIRVTSILSPSAIYENAV